ncbi:hypothetical protein B0H21DRAFT_705757 [Amylocystis lapponica]|nr:hypothetical protein B0H21DRAFT_705757 [Amylocystis lapponica]
MVFRALGTLQPRMGNGHLTDVDSATPNSSLAFSQPDYDSEPAAGSTVWLRDPVASYLSYSDRDDTEATDDAERDSEDYAEERRRDAVLAAEIVQRKWPTGERGVKLTVVLMANRRMLSTHAPRPPSDAQLMYVWRQSMLDSDDEGKEVHKVALEFISEV